MQQFYCIKIKTITDLYRFIRLRFDKITDLRDMQIFDKVYQTGMSGDLRCCTYLADTDMLRCLTSVKNSLKSLFSFHIEPCPHSTVLCNRVLRQMKIKCVRLMTGRGTD